MKLVKLFLVLLILSTSSLISYGQNNTGAPFDSFRTIALGELWMRIDGFVQQLENNPSNQGYVVLHPPKNSGNNSLRVVSRYANQIYNRIYQHEDFEQNRIKILIGQNKGTFEVNLWEISSNAENKFTNEKIWEPEPFDLTRAFMFGYESLEETYPTFAPKRYADLLKNNAGLRGHIVIFNSSKKQGQVQAKELLDKFEKKYKVSRNRLRIFFAKNKGEIDLEFWIVPKR